MLSASWKENMMSRVLFVGKGKLASKAMAYLQASIALSDDVNCSLDVLKRTELSTPDDKISSLYLGDVAEPASWQQLDKDYALVIYCLSPSGRTEQAYREVFYEGIKHCLAHFEGSKHTPKLLFVSSTSVYAQSQGEPVDEMSEALGSSPTSVALHEAEQLLAQSGLTHSVLRLSGIYGGSRNRMLKQLEQGQAVLSDRVRISNRIHEEDAARFIAYISEKALKGETFEPIYVVSDSCPVELNEVYRYLADQMAVALNTELADGAGGRRSGNKYLNNQKLRSSGFKLRFPSYKEGYAEMLKQKS